MTEREWRKAVWPGIMLDYLTQTCRVQRSGCGRRKLRLFGVAYCRRVEHLLKIADLRKLIDSVEEWADDLKKKVSVLKLAVRSRVTEGCGVADDMIADYYADLLRQYARSHLAAMAVSWLGCDTAEYGSRCYANAALALEGENIVEETSRQCDILRDIFGNPFRAPPKFDKRWRTDTAASLARGMYESRDFGAMPILADALQDAGCDSDPILNHCRSEGPHVRGCWVVDLVLGKA